MMARMSSGMFEAYETDDEAGMLLMEAAFDKDCTIVSLWGWMQAERARVGELEARLEAVKKVRDMLIEYSLPEDDPEDPDLELAQNIVKDLNVALTTKETSK